ncbi:hypothetical protein QQ045_011957 [Rhodiola kirilowii]
MTRWHRAATDLSHAFTRRSLLLRPLPLSTALFSTSSVSKIQAALARSIERQSWRRDWRCRRLGFIYFRLRSFAIPCCIQVRLSCGSEEEVECWEPYFATVADEVEVAAEMPQFKSSNSFEYSSHMSVVKEALHVSKVPSAILCREVEQNKILEFCKSCVEKEKAGSLYVCGCPMTGKSLSMEMVKQRLLEWAREILLEVVEVAKRGREGTVVRLGVPVYHHQGRGRIIVCSTEAQTINEFEVFYFA